MDFGEWVHKVRIKRNLDVRSLAGKTGVDGSTISRIENAKTQSTLYTAFRISDGLDVSFSTLIYELKGVYPDTQSLPEETSMRISENSASYESDYKKDMIVTINDIKMFINLFHTDSLACKAYLANRLNRIMANDVEKQPEIAEGEIFVPKDIDKLLFSSSIYHFELKYPSDLSAEALLTIYKQKGVMTLTDIGAYTRKVRSQKKVTLEKLEDAAKISSSVLSRLETGALDRIKLADILTLDEQLEQKWIIVGMYWEACRFQENFLHHQNYSNNERVMSSLEGSDDIESKLASVYITVHRWLHYFNLDKPTNHQY